MEEASSRARGSSLKVEKKVSEGEVARLGAAEVEESAQRRASARRRATAKKRGAGWACIEMRNFKPMS
jgi:hypothetical protein